VTLLRPLAIALAVAAALALVSDAVFVATFPSAPRLSANFSSAFVALELARLRAQPPETIVLGDSVLWGYDVSATQAVPALLQRSDARVANFTYEGGSPVNTYAMLRTMLARGVRPARVVFNLNQKTFNAADNAYSVVHPASWELARPLVSARDARLVTTPSDAQTPDARLDRAIARIWSLYGMRADLREALFGDVDVAHALDASLERATGADARRRIAHRATASAFEGTYDLSPLDDTNVSVHFLKRTIALLAAERIPAIAILTPTNHTLLHAYIDVPQYAANLAYVHRLLARGGVRVVDVDRAFGPADFFDNDHLTANANVRLAAILARELART
jgi:hypothetical protein